MRMLPRLAGLPVNLLGCGLAVLTQVKSADALTVKCSDGLCSLKPNIASLHPASPITPTNCSGKAVYATCPASARFRESHPPLFPLASTRSDSFRNTLTADGTLALASSAWIIHSSTRSCSLREISSSAVSSGRISALVWLFVCCWLSRRGVVVLSCLVLFCFMR